MTIRICGDEGMKYKLGELCDVVSGGTPSRAITEFWEALVLLDDVLAILDRRDDRRIRRRAAHAALLHRLDERRLGVAGGRLGEMLGLFLLVGSQAFGAVEIGQRRGALLGLVVAALFIHGGKAGEFQDLVAGAEGMARTACVAPLRMGESHAEGCKIRRVVYGGRRSVSKDPGYHPG